MGRAERHTQIVMLRHQGYSRQEIADAVGVTVSTVYTVLADNHMGPKDEQQKRLDIVIPLRNEDGYSPQKIAELTGIPYSLVQSTIHLYEKRGRRPKEVYRG